MLTVIYMSMRNPKFGGNRLKFTHGCHPTHCVVLEVKTLPIHFLWKIRGVAAMSKLYPIIPKIWICYVLWE